MSYRVTESAYQQFQTHSLLCRTTFLPYIASTHCAYPRKDGQAELAWVAWLHTGIDVIKVEMKIKNVKKRKKRGENKKKRL